MHIYINHFFDITQMVFNLSVRLGSLERHPILGICAGTSLYPVQFLPLKWFILYDKLSQMQQY